MNAADINMRAASRNRSGRRATMEDVGRLAGVSQVTVSRALSDPARVSAETQRKIREAIEITGFVPNAIAGALASNRSFLVTALVPSVTNIVYATMVKSFSDRMREKGYQILLSETGFSPEDEERAIATHLSRRPDAVLLTGVHHTAQAKKMLLAAGIPVVEVWDITENPIDLCVGFSHIAAGAGVAEFAAKKQYRKAATVTAGDERARRRQKAFVHRFGQLTGVETAQVNFDGAASLARGRQAFSRLIDDQGFDGGVVFCSSDLLAQGVLIEAGTRKLDVPGRYAVIGFGDQEFATAIEPALTTVHVDLLGCGSRAAEAVIARLEGGEGCEVIDLGFDIRQRASA